MPRPMTHDLLKSTIELAGQSVDYVAVTDLTDDTFIAEIMVTGPRGTGAKSMRVQAMRSRWPSAAGLRYTSRPPSWRERRW